MKAQKNHIRKITRTLALVLAAVLISSGSFAQKSLKQYDLNQFKSNLFSTTKEIITAINEVKIKKAFYEKDILLEEWMTDLKFWAENIDSANQQEVNSESTSVNVETEINEESLQLEEWMLNYNWIDKEEFDEQELVLEDWMCCPWNWTLYACL